MAVESPPAYAWDWLARQRVAWREIRSRLLTEQRSTEQALPGGRAASPTRTRDVGDVPDWSADHPDLVRPVPSGRGTDTSGRSGQDLRDLDTRAEVIAALRADYATDAGLRRTVDEVVAQVAFLGRLDVPLHELGVRAAPRGMRWWWCHLGGSGSDDGRSVGDTGHEHPSSMPVQLRLVDVLSGYGDVPDA